MVAMATPSDHRASRRVPTAAGSMLFLPIEAIPATWPPLPARCCSCRPMPSARHSCYLPCLLCRDRPPASCTVSADPPLLLADRRPAIRLARRTPVVSTDSMLLLADRPKFASRFFSPPAARQSGLPAATLPCQPTRLFLPITGNLPVSSSRRLPPDQPAMRQAIGWAGTAGGLAARADRAAGAANKKRREFFKRKFSRA